jgi:hypothetical protein
MDESTRTKFDLGCSHRERFLYESLFGGARKAPLDFINTVMDVRKNLMLVVKDSELTAREAILLASIHKMIEKALSKQEAPPSVEKEVAPKGRPRKAE